MSSAKNSAGAPCTHQFLVTLTVQTTKINPTLTPPPRSATSLTNTYPLLGTPSDAQQRGKNGDLAQAITEFETLLTDRTEVLGPDHPDTLTTRNNLAHWRRKGGDVAGNPSV
ncbi:tetratricopeptide repeat protein [Rhodococcus sp. IEGM 1351]|uniref:tetratricopeptide repeat protein n=1 Tax=Rhodococcus sp. IEGM 1351 TaxID=3047089 RepID=UPI0024B6A614|nr:tetratricopeptide repeat protein [Rhodococcus sp. IEGM 1351]MDI9941573.1 tetratricopeptide repeat protein [Rhodococcus sp. IEGM 1351]